MLMVLVTINNLLQGLRLRPADEYVEHRSSQRSFDQDRSRIQETVSAGLFQYLWLVTVETYNNPLNRRIRMSSDNAVECSEYDKKLLLFIVQQLGRRHVLVLESTEGRWANVLFFRERLPHVVTSFVLLGRVLDDTGNLVVLPCILGSHIFYTAMNVESNSILCGLLHLV